MSDVRSAWQDAGEQLGDLGQRLRAHYQEHRAEEGSGPEVREAVKRLAEAVQEAFEAVGSAAKNPEVREDVKQVGQSLSDALGVTFAEVSEDLRRAFRTASPRAHQDTDPDGEDKGTEEDPPPKVEPWGTP